MTASLHPHWHTVDADGVSVPIRTGENKTDSIHYAVRHPAAIVGILLVLGLGTFFVRGVHELRGQLGNTSPVVVRISATGLNPNNVSLAPGQTVTWRNEQDVPHILTSDTLPVEGGMLYSPHILPGTDFSARMAIDAEPGDFTYMSLTADDIVGTISITATPRAPSPPTLPQRPSLPLPITSPGASPPAAIGPSRPLAPLASIPRNPYALEGTPLPPPMLPSPLLPAPTTAPLPPLAATVRPFSQPQTGPKGIGVVIAVSILAIVGICALLSRKWHS